LAQNIASELDDLVKMQKVYIILEFPRSILPNLQVLVTNHTVYKPKMVHLELEQNEANHHHHN